MSADDVWRPNTNPVKPPLLAGDVYRPDILTVIEQTIDSLRPQLRELSDKIHGKHFTMRHPELINHRSSSTLLHDQPTPS